MFYIDAIILQLPDLVLYLASGFVSLTVFNFIATNRNPDDFQHLFVKSLVLGFVLKNLISIIPYRSQYQNVDIIVFGLICVIVSYFAAIIYASHSFEKFLLKIGIRRTVNTYLWRDLEDPYSSTWVEVTIGNVIYYGMLSAYEEFKSKPQIVLSKYEINDLKGNEIENNEDKPHKRIIIDTEKCDRIVIVYNENSKYINKRPKEQLEKDVCLSPHGIPTSTTRPKPDEE